MLGAIGAAASGMRVAETWMSATAENLANADDITPPGQQSYQAAEVQPAALPGLAGVTASVSRSQAAPLVTYDPGSPFAGPSGLVTRSNVDEVSDTVGMDEAASYFEFNVAVMRQADAAYRAAIALVQPQSP